ncbi:TauD/TfdA family dioxygenase [Streptomyces sp. rh34]|uniref:TauD/TfdA family dioxygenase n=1 Tax=Streptomyces sp. rh34 TaxID=2034272 RepID=UPI00211D4954|nr:TauD/TfdA family dioxygenase [Streptomyces sp. rh34]
MLQTDAISWQIAPGRPALAVLEGIGEGDDAAWLTERQPELRRALLEHGALCLRGLPIREVEGFARIRDVLIPQDTPYREKATPRNDFGQGVYSSTELPAAQSIEMHNENSYTLTFPGLLLFACLVAPEEGGATPIADCRAVLQAIPERLRATMRETGWRLTRSYSDHLSTDWRTAFGTDDRAGVEAYCADSLIGYQWQHDGNLRTGQVRPGIITHPETGDEVWFNHLAFWNAWALDEEIRETLIDEFGPEGLPFDTAFGNGARLTAGDLADIRAAYASATLRAPWQPGDLLLVDNIRCAHGRDPFRGDRRIVVAMGQPVALADCSPTVEPAAVVA